LNCGYAVRSIDATPTPQTDNQPDGADPNQHPTPTPARVA
jgi:hypothetical protein